MDPGSFVRLTTPPAPRFSHLHTRSWFSFLGGGSSPKDLAKAAAYLEQPALALTDYGGVYGAVRFQRACREYGIKPLFGAEVNVEGGTLVLIAASNRGYRNLCRLLTKSHLRERLAHVATIAELAEHSGDLFCLTGTRDSRLWQLISSSHLSEAQAWVLNLQRIFGDRLSIEVTHQLHPGDSGRIQILHRLSTLTYVPLVATGDIRFATSAHYRRYDLMSCIRLGITVFETHPERPCNAEAYLKGEETLRRLIPHPRAFERVNEIAEACDVNLLPGYITPPAARVPPPLTAREYLHEKCRAAFERRYPNRNRARAARQLAKELSVIGKLDLDEFFLVVHEIVEEARHRGIRCAGRGSAANSIVAYLLGITGVCPLEQNLLFERFLHSGRKGTPDIDVDFDSDRRDEIITWMDERFGMQQTAMTATLITYRTRSAIRDTAKALGWPMDVVNRLSKSVSPHAGSRLHDHRVHMEQIVGPSPLFDTMLDMAQDLMGCPRHLGLHSGGMVLSRKPLDHFTPIQISANGVKMVTFDKDDVEALGLVKFDVLGLRMLAALSEAVELVRRHAPPGHPDNRFEIDELPLDDAATYNMIRASETLGVFQIESQGQLHLLGQHQPENFMDLINEIALFRPGPLQSGMVHPFVRRRRKLEPVEYPHPSLEPVLKSTLGVIIYQEQVLEVAHRFAGMSLEEADEFRSLMSKFRDPGKMEGMRERFTQGAIENGIDAERAHEVFDIVSKFVGYGFCRSHAAAFAKTVYQSAYLKRHFTAAYMAAFMQHRPGFYSLMTVEEETRRFGVRILEPDIRMSGIRYDLEHTPDGQPAIRKPLTSVINVSSDQARFVVWERMSKAFSSIEDLYLRVPVEADALRSLARSGALDPLAGSSRRALWEIGLMERRVGQAGKRPTTALFDLPVITEEDIPVLPELSLEERLSWDLQTHEAARVHPMSLVRRTLNELEIRTIETCYRFGRYTSVGTGPTSTVITVAGISALRQRPPTANGVMFLTLEDETGLIQTIIQPRVLEHLDHVLCQSAVIVRGKLQIMGNWRGLVVTQAWPLNGILGGYEGHPSMDGGRDYHAVTYVDANKTPIHLKAGAAPTTE